MLDTNNKTKVNHRLFKQRSRFIFIILLLWMVRNLSWPWHSDDQTHTGRDIQTQIFYKKTLSEISLRSLSGLSGPSWSGIAVSISKKVWSSLESSEHLKWLWNECVANWRSSNWKAEFISFNTNMTPIKVPDKRRKLPFNSNFQGRASKLYTVAQVVRIQITTKIQMYRSDK